MNEAYLETEGAEPLVSDVPQPEKDSNIRPGSRLKTCPLVLACDKAYLMPLATTLRSIVESNRAGWPLAFHILSDGVSESSRAKVLGSLPRESASIRWLPVDLRLFGGFSTEPYVSRMTYARLMIPKVFPLSQSRVLYLDTDVLVLEDLAPLIETDLNGATIGAIIDAGLDSLVKRGAPPSEQMPSVLDYFNAGVLLIDLDRWRENQISEKALEYLVAHPRSPYMDQDGLNFACDRFWKKLDPRWNFQNHSQRKISQMRGDERPGIVHFVTSRKPWDPRVRSLNAGFYDAFRSRTGFARTPQDKLGDVLRSVWARFKDDLKKRKFLAPLWKLFGYHNPG